MSKLEIEHFGAGRREFALRSFPQARDVEVVGEDNDAMYRLAALNLGTDVPVTYIEFGVADGKSLAKMTKLFTHPESLFVGFDSFVGLPEDWMMHSRGAFSQGGQTPPIRDPRVQFVKGWFQNTFHSAMERLKPQLDRPVLIHFDADLYSSTLFLLTSLWPICPAYHFIMDDFMVDDIVALHDFSLSYPVDIEFIARKQGGVPHSILGKLHNKQFEIDSAPAELMTLFESIGENCEFGLVQRRCGAEPLGLFRFSSTPLPQLISGLRSKFENLGQLHNIEIQESSNGREYMVLDKCFGFQFHAWVAIGEIAPDDIATRESRRLPFLARKLTEDISLCEKIFVYHGMEPLNLHQVRELHSALRLYGPATLLWVELAGDMHAPGTVDWIEAGLLKGYMDRFAPGENAHDLSLDCWVMLCRNAVDVWRSAQPSSATALAT